MAEIIPVLFGVLFVITLITAYFNRQYQDQRNQELRALAERRGLTFLPDGMDLKNSGWSLFGSSQPKGPVAEFSDWFPLFRKGSSQRIQPALVGYDSKGTYWFLFDYRYEEKDDESTTTYRYSVVVAQLPFNLPQMILAQESMFNSIGKLFGNHELQVESEEFNQRYNIQTSDQKMALDLLHPTAIETLLAQPTLEWQMTGPYIMLHLYDTLSASDYEGLMGCLALFVDQIPNYYREDHSLTGVHA